MNRSYPAGRSGPSIARQRLRPGPESRSRPAAPEAFASLAILLAFAGCGPVETAPAQDAEPAAVFGPPTVGDYAVVTGWPAYPGGVEIGQASGVAVTSDDEVILFQRGLEGDRNAEGLLDAPTLMVFDAQSGELLRTMGEGMFANPHGLGLDAEDNLWIADNRLHQLIKMSPEGEVLMTIGEAGVPGEDETHLNGVTDVAIASDGSIWASDGYGNNRIVKYAPDGTFLLSVGGERGSGPGEFDLPHGITIDAQDRVYVADRTNARVQIFDQEGEYLGEWDHWEGNEPGDAGRPWGLEFRDGSIYVADGGEYWLGSQFYAERPDTLPFEIAQIQRFDTEGNLLDAWGHFGRQEGRMIWTHDVSVDSEGGVYSVEVNEGQRLQKWSRGGGSIR